VILQNIHITQWYVRTGVVWYNPSTLLEEIRMKLENFDNYQRESRKTWSLIHTDHPIVYPTLGLVNEAGELAGKVKKIFRDKAGKISDEDRNALKYELGDVLWYMAQIATELDLSLQDVAEANLEKLFSRLERGQIKGEGDYR
jgi:NTP pyrophosphatase (non-canonical NTP hydrolase)